MRSEAATRTPTGFFVGRILPDPGDEKDIGHEDFASSYPAEVICSREFPMGRLMDCTNSLRTIDDITWYARNYWLVVRAVFIDTHLKNPYRTKCPYIPFAKMTRREHKKDCVNDNGRLISQDGAFEFCFLGVEWDIIRSQYTGKIKVLEAYYCPKGYLPGQLRKNCFEWYKKKTELKGVSGKAYEYMKSKNRVNSYY